MSSYNDNNKAASSNLRGLWATTEPTRHDYVAVVSKRNALKLCGESSVFERGLDMPNPHMAFFKPPMDAFAVDLKSKDRWFVKECEYVNGAGVWIETGPACLSTIKESECGDDVLSLRL